jgi:hypothetical protein
MAGDTLAYAAPFIMKCDPMCLAMILCPLCLYGWLQSMSGYGYLIIHALVNDIEPAPRVKDQMNEINAARRMRYGRQLFVAVCAILSIQFMD